MAEEALRVDSLVLWNRFRLEIAQLAAVEVAAGPSF
jgi:hypothetical protein